MTDTIVVKLSCKVNSDYSLEIVNGVLTISFEREVNVYQSSNVNDDELGEIQSNMLWECFDSTLEVISSNTSMKQ